MPAQPPDAPPESTKGSPFRKGMLGFACALTLLALGVALSGTEVASLGGWVSAVAAACAAVTALAPRLGAFFTSVGAAAASAYLFARKLAPDSEASICTVSETFDCDTINSSAWSEVFGVPVSVFGLGFYVGLAVASLPGPKRSPRFYQVTALFSLFSVAYSVYLAGVSVSIGLVCIFCASMYVANVILLAAGLHGVRASGRRLLDDPVGMGTSRSFLTLSGVFFLVVFVAGGRWQVQQSPDALASLRGAPDLTRYYAKPPGPVGLGGDEPVLGLPDAAYLVVEFADFQCPHCATASRQLKHLVEDYPDVQVRFRAYPLSGKCNPSIPTELGDLGRCRAAAAAECATRQGRFWDVTPTIFANPGYFELDDLRFIAGQHELDLEAWDVCMADPSALQSVIEDAEAGVAAGVEGTPTLYLRLPDGEWLLITHGIDALARVIDAHRSGVDLPPAHPAPPAR